MELVGVRPVSIAVLAARVRLTGASAGAVLAEPLIQDGGRLSIGTAEDMVGHCAIAGG